MATGIDTQGIQAFRNRYLGPVASRCFVPTASAGANKQQMSRTAHFARDHIVGVKLVLANYFVNNSGLEVGTGGPADFTASVEYPSGVFNQALFNGAVQVTVPSGGIVVTDMIKVTAPRLKQLWSKVWRSDPLGIIYSPFPFLKSNALLGDALNFSGTTVPDTTMTATATNLDAGNMYGPIAIIGYTRRGTVLLLGDSLAAGQGDTADATGDVGLFRYLMADKACINMGRPTDTALLFKDNSVNRRSLGQYVSDILLQHTINDLSTRTDAELRADLITIGNQLRAAYPNKRLWLTTAVPQTNAGNTVTNSTSNPKRVPNNDWKRAVPDPFDGCIELADGVEATRNSGLFASSTYTADGTHMADLGYKAITTAAFARPDAHDF